MLRSMATLPTIPGCSRRRPSPSSGSGWCRWNQVSRSGRLGRARIGNHDRSCRTRSAAHTLFYARLRASARHEKKKPPRGHDGRGGLVVRIRDVDHAGASEPAEVGGDDADALAEVEVLDDLL